MLFGELEVGLQERPGAGKRSFGLVELRRGRPEDVPHLRRDVKSDGGVSRPAAHSPLVAQLFHAITTDVGPCNNDASQNLEGGQATRFVRTDIVAAKKG